MTLDPFHIGAAARTVWGEARGEGAAGMQAVACVIWNRLKDGRWGKTLAEVCLDDDVQFSCWDPRGPNRKAMLHLAFDDAELSACRGLVSSADTLPVDPTGGATHYYADSIPAPFWVLPRLGDLPPIQTAHIGHHIFFKRVK